MVAFCKVKIQYTTSYYCLFYYFTFGSFNTTRQGQRIVKAKKYTRDTSMSRTVLLFLENTFLTVTLCDAHNLKYLQVTFC